MVPFVNGQESPNSHRQLSQAPAMFSSRQPIGRSSGGNICTGVQFVSPLSFIKMPVTRHQRTLYNPVGGYPCLTFHSRKIYSAHSR